MAKSDLQRFLEAPKSGHRLLGHIERHMMTRPQGDRSTLVLHPSEVIKRDWCYRYQTYLLLGGEKKGTKPALRLQSIFDEGHFIHAKWQNWFAEMGNLYGRWETIDKEDLGWGTSADVEYNSAPHRIQYREVPLRYEPLRVGGHSDGWIKGLGEDCLIEIKSIGAGTVRMEDLDLFTKHDGDLMKLWSDIRRPFRGHLMQGQLYLWLAEKIWGEDAPKEIVFIYELKADQSYKEFTVKKDSEVLERVIYGMEYVNDFADQTKLPKCNIDPDGCKYCNEIPEDWNVPS